MLLGVFHMLSVLYIWFVLFDLRYLVLRVHHQLCAICLLSPPLLLSLPPLPLLYCHTPARRFPSKTKLGRWVQKKYLLILEQTQPWFTWTEKVHCKTLREWLSLCGLGGLGRGHVFRVKPKRDRIDSETLNNLPLQTNSAQTWRHKIVDTPAKMWGMWCSPNRRRAYCRRARKEKKTRSKSRDFLECAGFLRLGPSLMGKELPQPIQWLPRLYWMSTTGSRCDGCGVAKTQGEHIEEQANRDQTYTE